MRRLTWNVWLAVLIIAGGCGGTGQSEARRGDEAETTGESTTADSSTAVSAGSSEANAESAAAAISADATATADETGDTPKADSERQLRLEKLVLTVPEGWQRKALSNSFVLAEFTLPRAEGDQADGRLTVSVAGGDIHQNIERWRGQFGGNPEQSSEKRKEIDGMEVVIVDMAGEFADQAGPFAPAIQRPDYRMLAAIIPVDGELHFIKAVGPQATIAAHADRIHEFVDSAKKKR